MIRIGTCSWTEKTFKGNSGFYPEKIKSAEERLKYYAEHFDTVEVDSAYYAIPLVRNVIYWAERTPDNFIFHIKAYAVLTGHGIDPRTLPGDIFKKLSEKERLGKQIYLKDDHLLKQIACRFVESLTPLLNANKLGVIVFQFPPWFRYKSDNLAYLLKCKELMQNLPLAIEFRHGSWLAPEKRDSVFHFLRKHQFSYICADEPQYGSLATVPFLPELTSEIAYFRLHGRNRENWLKRGIETSLRYDYYYSDEELRDFLSPIFEINKRAKTTYVMFNNCHGGAAFKNALRLKEFLSNFSSIN